MRRSLRYIAVPRPKAPRKPRSKSTRAGDLKPLPWPQGNPFKDSKPSTTACQRCGGEPRPVVSFAFALDDESVQGLKWSPFKSETKHFYHCGIGQKELREDRIEREYGHVLIDELSKIVSLVGWGMTNKADGSVELGWSDPQLLLKVSREDASRPMRALLSRAAVLYCYYPPDPHPELRGWSSHEQEGAA